MLRKIGRLFVIKTRWEAYLIIYALALGATTRPKSVPNTGSCIVSEGRT